MTSLEILAKRAGNRATPAWEIALLFPEQGHWSEEEYLHLTDRTNQLVELTNGAVEVLPMPSRKHQKILAFMYEIFLLFIRARNLGTLLFAPLRVRLRSGLFREPDLVFVLAEHSHLEGEAFFTGADLVLEVVSPDDPDRDLVTKRREYAQTGIPEYWIVNPIDETVTVLQLEDQAYTERGIFRRGDAASSGVLIGLNIAVDRIFDLD